ncbi:MAG: hypothetical protein K8L99_11045 [Anaerolineae bacterium]|nr:hypothetical protein [Anaerolineae bacterium]
MPHFMLSFWLFVLFTVISLTGNPVNAQANNFELGGQILTFIHPDEMHEAGMTWLKMQITFHQNGSTGDARNVIDHARRHGFKVLLSIIGVKSELQANPTQYYQDYANFLAQVAALNPDAIEVWNEPNIDQEWPVGIISGTNYTKMLKKAYPAIKQANANVMVISGAPAPTGYFGGTCTANGCDDNIFIEQMATANAGDYLDCVGMHYNEGVLPPSATSGDPRGNSSHYTRYYPKMVQLYQSVFPGKPLCFTELGYLTPSGLGSLPPGMEWGANTTAREQADWLAEAAVLSRDGGKVRLMIVWNVDAPFTSSNPHAGWAMIRQNDRCLPCATLHDALSGGPQQAPNLIAPANNAWTNSGAPQFTWDSVADATSYQIQIDNNSDFSSPERDASPTTTTYTASPQLTDTLYYWRVRGISAAGSGPWSDMRSFKIDTQPPAVPVLRSPQNAQETTTNRPIFSWDAVTGATSYEMRLGTNNPPQTLMASGDATSYQPPSSLVAGHYYWQVRALDAAGNVSAWSTPFSLTITSPANEAPLPNYHTTSTVTLSWGALDGATAYEIQVDTQPSFANPLVYSTIVEANALQVTTPPLTNGIYYWRVRAQRSGTWTGWSTVERFGVRLP